MFLNSYLDFINIIISSFSPFHFYPGLNSAEKNVFICCLNHSKLSSPSWHFFSFALSPVGLLENNFFTQLLLFELNEKEGTEQIWFLDFVSENIYAEKN